jgi:hypothetical protein
MATVKTLEMMRYSDFANQTKKTVVAREPKLTDSKARNLNNRIFESDDFTRGLREEPSTAIPIDYNLSGVDASDKNTSDIDFHDLHDFGTHTPKFGGAVELTKKVQQVEVEMPDFYKDFENNFDRNTARAAADKEQMLKTKHKPRMETCDKCGTVHNALEICNCQKIAREKELHSNKLPFEILAIIILGCAITLFFLK